MIQAFKYKKRPTNTVQIGSLMMGSEYPVRIQSMTNTDTNNVEATANQIIDIYKAGADLVRITVQTSFVAEKIIEIKDLLQKKGYSIPLVADIHFSPKAAERAAELIEKVRVNPGNYIDKKEFKRIEYSEIEYKKEIEKIRKNFLPLIEICKKHKTALRIGTNHGSLSDRILSRYGDTPKGMVESTMEFLRICKEEDFNDVVISMKASNPIVMVQAVRLLVEKMDSEDMHYPIHLGVTEAGNELEGRIKSAVGIGALLIDGIGDTIRVSLTESPEREIPCAIQLAELFSEQRFNSIAVPERKVFPEYNLLTFKKRASKKIGLIGGNQVPVVVCDIKEVTKETLNACGFRFNNDLNALITNDLTADFLYSTVVFPKPLTSFKLNLIGDTKSAKQRFLVSYNKLKQSIIPDKIGFLEISPEKLTEKDFEFFKTLPSTVFVLNLTGQFSAVHLSRMFFADLDRFKIKNPVIIKKETDKISEKEILQLSAEIGSLLIDGYGDGIWISVKDDADLEKARELSFGILQACRVRITKTEYISCPSCGRTLFNLEETTAKIKEKTAHLKGLKIGIMGCIVNGPGEMADADFGYVGTGPGKVTLYRKHEVVKRNIPEKDAVKELLDLIEQYLKKN